MLMFTTETIPGYEIEEYLGYVSETVTLGINDFTEFFQISDTFGGESSTYKSKFDEAKEILNRRLKTKTEELGGNAIIGLRINYSEISGKNKSSILISGTATAIKIKENEKYLKNLENEKQQEEKIKEEQMKKYEKLGIANWLKKNNKI